MSRHQIRSEVRDASATPPTRYSTGAMVFHWTSALMVAVLVGTGWWMLQLISDPARMKSAFPIFQFHKSLGMAVLVITLGRIALRLCRKAPALPAAMPGWERLAALVAQASFYLLLVAIPISGWLYISTEWAESLDKEFRSPTLFFGQFVVPYASAIADAEAGVRRTLSFHLSGVHAWLAYTLLILAGLHVAAALKHHFVNRDDVLSHMVPGLDRRAGPKTNPGPLRSGLASARIWLVAGLIVAFVAALGWINSPAPPRSPAVEIQQRGTQ